MVVYMPDWTDPSSHTVFDRIRAKVMPAPQQFQMRA
jgi:hypothetical protein